MSEQTGSWARIQPYSAARPRGSKGNSGNRCLILFTKAAFLFTTTAAFYYTEPEAQRSIRICYTASSTSAELLSINMSPWSILPKIRYYQRLWYSATAWELSAGCAVTTLTHLFYAKYLKWPDKWHLREKQWCFSGYHHKIWRYQTVYTPPPTALTPGLSIRALGRRSRPFLFKLRFRCVNVAHRLNRQVRAPSPPCLAWGHCCDMLELLLECPQLYFAGTAHNNILFQQCRALTRCEFRKALLEFLLTTGLDSHPQRWYCACDWVMCSLLFSFFFPSCSSRWTWRHFSGTNANRLFFPFVMSLYAYTIKSNNKNCSLCDA